MQAFRERIEARDLAGVAALLADEVTFTSPVAHQPYQGKAITVAILEAAIEVLGDFHYVREIEQGPDSALIFRALIFRAHVGDRELTGCDFIHVDEQGLIDDLMVMVRPFSGAAALKAAMAARYDAIAERAAQLAGGQ